jgi:hypothetical protein
MLQMSLGDVSHSWFSGFPGASSRPFGNASRTLSSGSFSKTVPTRLSGTLEQPTAPRLLSSARVFPFYLSAFRN